MKRSKKSGKRRAAVKKFFSKKRRGSGSSGKINWMNHFTTALIAAVGLFGINYLGNWIAKQAKIDPKYNEIFKVALALSPLGLAMVFKKYKPQLQLASSFALATVIYDEAKKRLPVTMTAQLSGVGYIPEDAYARLPQPTFERTFVQRGNLGATALFPEPFVN